MINNDNMQWFLPTVHNIPTTSLPKCFIFLCVHQGSDVQQKHIVPPLTLPLATSFFRPSFLPPSLPPPLPCMFLLFSPPHYHFTSFPFLNNNRLPRGFSFHFVMILTLLPFCHFPFNKKTSRTNILLHINPTSRWKLFRVEF
jgi:hypothetical protein